MEIEYKGFVAKIFFSPEVGAFCGEILNLEDVITFQVAFLEDAMQIMQEAIEHYLFYLDIIQKT